MVARLAAITTSSEAARNSSGLLVRAACANSRGSSKRPPTNRIATVNTARPPTLTNPAQPAAAAIGPSAPSTKMIGTSARSSNSSIANAVRPTGLAVPAIGNTSAVEDRASAIPSAIDPVQASPISRCRPVPRIMPDAISCAAPVPKTNWRIDHRRLNDSSSPIENSSNTMPNSAKGSIACGSEIVMWYNQG